MRYVYLSLKRAAAGGILLLAALPALAGLAVRADAPVPHYRITDLGTLGGATSGAWGLNDLGQVVGWSDLADSSRHAFLYTDGSMRDLGTLPGGQHSYATAINDRGQVAGYSGVNEFGPGFKEVLQGFLWDKGSMRSIGSLYCPCSFNDRYGNSTGYAINDLGWITGSSGTVRGSWVQHGTLWEDGQLQDLGGGAGDWSISRIFGVNDFGLLVGDYASGAGMLNSFDRHASLWRGGVRTDIGALPGHASSTALAVSLAGTVAGWSGSADGSVSRAFLWHRGHMHDLGTLAGDANSAAMDVNAFGQAVGWSGNAEGDASHAFLWTGGRMFDLNRVLPVDSGWVLTSAHAINLSQQIAGTGLHNGQMHAFLLSLPGRDAQMRRPR